MATFAFENYIFKKTASRKDVFEGCRAAGLESGQSFLARRGLYQGESRGFLPRGIPCF